MRTNTLSTRQVQVLQLAAEGLEYAEIGERLFITHPTVKRHLSLAYGKLGARNAAHAVALAIGAGVIRPPMPTVEMLAA